MEIASLIIAYNRPQYLSTVLNALHLVQPSEVFISFDAPNTSLNDYELVTQGITLAQYYFHHNKFINIEEKKLGCKGHVLKALKWVVDNSQQDFILILEDDIVLTDIAGTRIQSFIDNYEPEKPSILKLNDYFWGWVCHKDVIKSIMSGIEAFIEEYTSCNYNPKDLYQFKNKYAPMFKDVNNVVIMLEPIKVGTYLPWDEEYDLIMKFKGIKEVKDSIKYVDNIGHSSSRDMSIESDYYGSGALRFYVENGKPIYF
jgi:GR25 family glycosyltransferase involved in LPS biosynthesis